MALIVYVYITRRGTMLFSKYIFDDFKETEIHRNTMEINDPDLEHYFFIAANPAIKSESRECYAEEEYIYSYLKAAKILIDSIKCPKGIKILINDHSLSIPILFSCRHCVELSIKFFLKSKANFSPKTNHDIKTLWEELKKALLKDQDKEGIQIIDNMERFVEFILSIDKESTRLRYSKQKDNSYSLKDLKFVNLRKIVDLTDKFVKQLGAITK